ncbi:hypothetical protein PSD17_33770, partial [Pseudonocardia sp. D17]
RPRGWSGDAQQRQVRVDVEGPGHDQPACGHPRRTPVDDHPGPDPGHAAARLDGGDLDSSGCLDVAHPQRAGRRRRPVGELAGPGQLREGGGVEEPVAADVGVTAPVAGGERPGVGDDTYPRDAVGDHGLPVEHGERAGDRDHAELPDPERERAARRCDPVPAGGDPAHPRAVVDRRCRARGHDDTSKISTWSGPGSRAGSSPGSSSIVVIRRKPLSSAGWSTVMTTTTLRRRSGCHSRSTRTVLVAWAAISGPIRSRSARSAACLTAGDIGPVNVTTEAIAAFPPAGPTTSSASTT